MKTKSGTEQTRHVIPKKKCVSPASRTWRLAEVHRESASKELYHGHFILYYKHEIWTAKYSKLHLVFIPRKGFWYKVYINTYMTMKVIIMKGNRSGHCGLRIATGLSIGPAISEREGGDVISGWRIVGGVGSTGLEDWDGTSSIGNWQRLSGFCPGKSSSLHGKNKLPWNHIFTWRRVPSSGFHIYFQPENK